MRHAYLVQDAIAEALRKDMGRPRFEAVVYDVLVPLADVKVGTAYDSAQN